VPLLKTGVLVVVEEGTEGAKDAKTELQSLVREAAYRVVIAVS
jgi:hypothetical protein